ncbi:hypothetical protein GQ44DRAFT_763464 [Phaeosphaeriaceae sp. PMI808]|nr:hypothetical protein GQ44DRAFT_763464 [Phaeosphaeriaceae sp. PMI808]
MNSELRALSPGGGNSASSRKRASQNPTINNAARPVSQILSTETVILDADSAYQSRATSLCQTGYPSMEPSYIRSELYRIPGKDVFIFPKAHDKVALTYAEGVRYAIEGKLAEDIFTKDPSRWKDLAVEFRMIGKTFDLASLHLVIFCAPDLKESVNRILQLSVVNELRASHRPEIPSLEILVIPESPKQMSAEVEIEICGQRAYLEQEGTYCGSPIILRASKQHSEHGSARKSTFGGVIKVTYGNGDIRYYGMTAGHAVEDAKPRDDAPASSQDEGRDGFDPSGWVTENDVLGHVVHHSKLPGVAAGRARPTHDWATFELSHTLPNKAVRSQSDNHNGDSDSREILIAEHPYFQDGISEPVELLGAAGGSRRGELSSLPARIWLAHSTCFVDAYMFRLEEGTALEGDSGAWVVHSAAPKLYGQIVATNVFGESYMMPAIKIFENMRECFGAASVTLPGANDLTQATPRTSRSTIPLAEQKKRDGLWDSVFSRPRQHCADRTFLQAMLDIGAEGGLINVFLRDVNDSVPSWDNEIIKEFCKRDKKASQVANAGPHSDVCYFKDIKGQSVKNALEEIRVNIRKLDGLKVHLASSNETWEKLVTLLNLRMKFETNTSLLESKQSEWRAAILNQETNRISRKIQEINTITAKEAMYTSKVIRANDILIWVTTPCLLALLYFGAEPDILPFERNAKTFVISIVLLGVVLPSLAYLLDKGSKYVWSVWSRVGWMHPSRSVKSEVDLDSSPAYPVV